jgi:hypothetical protein
MSKGLSVLITVIALGIGLGAGICLARAGILPSGSGSGKSSSSQGNACASSEEERIDAGEANSGNIPEGWTLHPSAHDFGAMREGEAETVSFSIKHPGEGPLKLGRIYSPCPCIFVTAPRRTIPEGEDATVNVKIHSFTLNGEVAFPVYVEVLEPEKAVLEAQVSATINRVPATVLLQPTALHLGAIDAEAEKSLTLTNLAKEPLRIRDVAFGADGLVMEKTGPALLSGGEALEVTIAVSAMGEIPEGPLRSAIVIETDRPEHAVIRVPVDGTVTR